MWDPFPINPDFNTIEYANAFELPFMGLINFVNHGYSNNDVSIDKCEEELYKGKSSVILCCK